MNPKRPPWLIRNTQRLLLLLRTPGQLKHAPKWVVSHRQQNYLLNAPSPWMAFDAIGFIKAQITPGWRVFEYGSGGSTLFWLKYGANVVSIEHDKQWYAMLQQRLSAYPNVDYRLVPPEPGDICEPHLGDIADPNCYRSGEPQFTNNLNFRRYATAIDEFPDEYFDMVVVDGRVRPSCIMHSAPKIKPGGLLVLDNPDRTYYLERTGPFLRDFTLHHFHGSTPQQRWYSHTSVYVKRPGDARDTYRK